MDIAIMLEGQEGLNWARLKRIARAAEDLGFAGIYRSDHFTDPHPPDQDSLELWVSLTWLASHTTRIVFGSLVSPVSFRDPVMLARMAMAVDDLSGGRLTLGIGAGWQEREHHMFGYTLLDVPERFARFAEALEVTTRLIRSSEPVDMDGVYYQLRGAILLPRGHSPGRPPIAIGGNGEQRSLPLAARYADEWNAVFAGPERFASLSARLDELLVSHGRRPQDVRRSLMTALVYGRTQEEVRAGLVKRRHSIDELYNRGIIIGTSSEVVEQLGRLADAGVECIMLQGFDMDDMRGLEAFAADVLPHFHHS